VSRARSGEPLAAITGVSSVPQNAGLLSSEYNKDKRMSDTKSRDTARVPYGGRPGRGGYGHRRSDFAEMPMWLEKEETMDRHDCAPRSIDTWKQHAHNCD